MTTIDRGARILILGAGAGGLSAAWFLRRYGYRNVTIFEKSGRVGGLCRSVTEDNQSFDLGAAVVSPDYREIRRLARRVGARMDRVEGVAAFRLDANGAPRSKPAPFHRLLTYLAQGDSLAARWRFYSHCARYVWKRFRLRRLFRRAGWAGMEAPEGLHVAFRDWLRQNDLLDLERLFEIPVTAFGYGDLDEIAALYALRYLSPLTFLSLLLSAARFSWIVPSRLLLRRFRFGFQRFWERVAWDLNVRLDIEIETIERDPDAGITVTYRHPTQLLGSAISHTTDRTRFDYLVIACPLIRSELESFLSLTEEERQLQEKIRFIPYAVASFEVADVVLPERVAFHLPLPARGAPMIVYQAHPDNELMAFYARLPTENPSADDELRFRRQIERCVQAFGGRIRDDDDWHSYDAWLYFKHVDAIDLKRGYFDDWERLQGTLRTFYTGGLFDFDYVEGITRYSRQLVETYFLGRGR
jgi:monoamine oxidase